MRRYPQAVCFCITLSACGAALREEPEDEGVTVPNPRVVSVTPPSAETCASGADEALSCQSLGLYATPTPLTGQPSAVSVSARALSVSGRNGHTCAALESGFVHCWNGSVLGLGADWFETARVPGLSQVASVSAGQSHSCAVTRDHEVWCWGSNDRRQVGVEDSGTLEAPVKLADLAAVSVSAGGGHSCAVLLDETVACWGDNSRHQLGVADVDQSAAPVFTDRKARALDAGLSTTCIVRPGGTAACWGADLEGQAYTADDSDVTGISGAVDVAVGRSHACALLVDGRVHCWGANALGQLGTGPGVAGEAAVSVPDVEGAVAIGTGGDVTCAVLESGDQVCWGGFAPQPDLPAQGS